MEYVSALILGLTACARANATSVSIEALTCPVRTNCARPSPSYWRYSSKCMDTHSLTDSQPVFGRTEARQSGLQGKAPECRTRGGPLPERASPAVRQGAFTKERTRRR